MENPGRIGGFGAFSRPRGRAVARMRVCLPQGARTRGSVLPACRRLVSTEVRAQHLAFTVDVTGELVVRDGSACLARASSCSSSVRRDGPRSSVNGAEASDLQHPDGGVRGLASACQFGDYLADEVLAELPAGSEVSAAQPGLARFAPEWCDRFIGREDMAAVLAELARSCTASSVQHRKRRLSPAPNRSACLSPVNHPGDPGPARPKSRRASGMLGLACQRTATASSSKEKLGARYASAFRRNDDLRP